MKHFTLAKRDFLIHKRYFYSKLFVVILVSLELKRKPGWPQTISTIFKSKKKDWWHKLFIFCLVYLCKWDTSAITNQRNYFVNMWWCVCVIFCWQLVFVEFWPKLSLGNNHYPFQPKKNFIRHYDYPRQTFFRSAFLFSGWSDGVDRLENLETCFHNWYNIIWAT